MAVPVIKSFAPGLSFSDYQSKEVNKSATVEICFFETDEKTGNSKINPKCFTCKQSLIELPKLTMGAAGLNQPVSGRYLVCPDSLQFDSFGNPTGRLVSWAHNGTLLNVESIMVAQAYKTMERKFYMKPKCQHGFDLTVLNRAERAGMSETHMEIKNGEQAPKWELFYKVAKVLQDLVASDEFKNGDKRYVSKAMAMDFTLCQIVDNECIRLQSISQAQKKEGAKRYNQKAGMTWTPSIMESFTNGTVKYGAFLGAKKASFHRFYSQCLHWSCAAWSPIFKQDDRNSDLIYSNVINFDASDKLNKDKVITQTFYLENVLPMSYIIANDLKASLHPQEWLAAQWISEAGIVSGNEWGETALLDFLDPNPLKRVAEDDILSAFLIDDKKAKTDLD
jgi:hypothetical protein